MKLNKLFGFTDVLQKYINLEKLYNRFDKGKIILAPPGSGKTTFVQNQKGKKRDWIDADDLCGELGVDWGSNISSDSDRLSYLRVDYILEQTKLYGLNVIGSLFWDYYPDAIVVIELEVHKKYISKRPDLDYNNVMKIRKYLEHKSEKNNIPLFTTIEDAINYTNNNKIEGI